MQWLPSHWCSWSTRRKLSASSKSGSSYKLLRRCCVHQVSWSVSDSLRSQRASKWAASRERRRCSQGPRTQFRPEWRRSCICNDRRSCKSCRNRNPWKRWRIQESALGQWKSWTQNSRRLWKEWSHWSCFWSCRWPRSGRSSNSCKRMPVMPLITASRCDCRVWRASNLLQKSP